MRDITKKLLSFCVRNEWNLQWAKDEICEEIEKQITRAMGLSLIPPTTRDNLIKTLNIFKDKIYNAKNINEIRDFCKKQTTNQYDIEFNEEDESRKEKWVIKTENKKPKIEQHQWTIDFPNIHISKNVDSKILEKLKDYVTIKETKYCTNEKDAYWWYYVCIDLPNWFKIEYFITYLEYTGQEYERKWLSNFWITTEQIWSFLQGLKNHLWDSFSEKIDMSKEMDGSYKNMNYNEDLKYRCWSNRSCTAWDYLKNMANLNKIYYIHTKQSDRITKNFNVALNCSDDNFCYVQPRNGNNVPRQVILDWNKRFNKK